MKETNMEERKIRPGCMHADCHHQKAHSPCAFCMMEGGLAGNGVCGRAGDEELGEFER